MFFWFRQIQKCFITWNGRFTCINFYTRFYWLIPVNFGSWIILPSCFTLYHWILLILPNVLGNPTYGNSKLWFPLFSFRLGTTSISQGWLWDLYCPWQIPGNTGCIARTCAASAVGLHLVGVSITVLIQFVNLPPLSLLLTIWLVSAPSSAIRISGGWYKIKACWIGLLAVS